MRAKGLTLVEVLVVIAVIALLSTISIPVLQKSKQQGKDLICVNNLRQLGVAVFVYANEKITYPQGFCGNPNCHPSIPIDDYRKLNTSLIKDWQLSWWWFHFLTDIIEEDFSKGSILSCPSKQLTDASLSKNILCGNYGINYAICKISTASSAEFSGTPLRPDQVKSPAGKLLLMDSGYALISWKAFVPDASLDPAAIGFELESRQDSYFLPGVAINQSRFENGSINENQKTDALDGRHSSDKVNAVFADGHVDRKRTESVEPALDTDGNVSNLSFWAP